MKHTTLSIFLFVCLTLGVSNAYASTKCKGSPLLITDRATKIYDIWHNCVGAWYLSEDVEGKIVADFRNGEPNGQMVYIQSDGSKYFGGFISENSCKSACGRHGHGTRIWPNGNRYVGEWNNNNWHGQGMLTFPNGQYYVGMFENNERTGGGFYSVDKKKLTPIDVSNVRSDLLCETATTVRNRATRSWDTHPNFKEFVLEAKRRNLKCDVGSFSTQTKAGTQVRKKKKDFSGLGGFLTGLALCSLTPEPATCLAGIGGKRKKVGQVTNGLRNKTCQDIAGLVTCSDQTQMTFIRGTMRNSNGEEFIRNIDTFYGNKGSTCEIDKFFPDRLTCK